MKKGLYCRYLYRSISEFQLKTCYITFAYKVLKLSKHAAYSALISEYIRKYEYSKGMARNSAKTEVK